MSQMDYLPENPNYVQDFKFPDTVNNNLKIKYHYLDGTFTVGGGGQSSFILNMMNRQSNLLKNYKNVKSIELISALFDTGAITIPIVYMYVKEFESLIDSTQSSGQGAFSKLFFDFISVDGSASLIAKIDNDMNPIQEWETKGKRIDTMTISFRLLGAAAPITFANTNIISLTFKIGVIEPLGPR